MSTFISNMPVRVVAPRKRRLLSPQRILVTLLSLILLCAIACGGIGYYFSNVLLVPTHDISYNLEATNVSAQVVTLPHTQDTEQPGTFGITWANGAAIVGKVTNENQDTVTRQLLQTTAPLASHTMVSWNREIYLNGLKDTLELHISTVQVSTSLGEMPAWYVPGKLDTWGILVHGRGDTLDSSLRFMQPLAKLGIPMLAISYRNDMNAPASPDGYYHLGDTEWQDLEAGVKYALAHGAHHLVLYGWSMGGAIVEAFQHRSQYASNVQALVLDAPLLDWRSTLSFQAASRYLPDVVASTAEFFAAQRAKINFDALNQLNQPQGKTPILLFHGTNDTTTPVSVSDTFAQAHTDIVTYNRVNGADHVQSWNLDPQWYNTQVESYLTRVLHL
ncbi:alpha/beta hydrolase family protein [Ktedonobacter robiniae]|uniref:Peptidase S9 prolyl oligopeptidase catalytic domain-containing protein n=1 Tax=Ktedonobacter robiniae TaxID=2778365 RepID=A0ABQ3UGK8_9CHLR|nr:alpha/beta fold hydrolase [Ktedonobacter robiniae]GHO51834.1 hypothetical protein KSB_03090 [Ktedonobacter robiniae]